MAIGDYNNLTPEARLDKVGELLVKGICFYHRNKNDEIERLPNEKETALTSKTKRREDIDLVPTINPDEKIFTIKETTEFLKISRTTLWRLNKRKELPCYMIGNRSLLRFKLSEILSYLETKCLDNRV